MKTLLLGAAIASWAVGTALPANAACTADVSATLKAKTQAFSDAGQLNRGAALAPMLDDDVVFYNEGGDRAAKADMSSDGPPPAKEVVVKMTVTDWDCQLHGEVAVTSFVDDKDMVFYGERSHARFRSVESWLNGKGGWLMISSATIALNDDPPAVQLPAALLDEYSGRYALANGTTMVFTHRENTLLASLNGGPQTPQSAELRDVIFTPGRARARKVFQRDTNGHIVGFVVRQEGHDYTFHRTG